MGDGFVVCDRGGERLFSAVGRCGREAQSLAIVGDGSSVMVLAVGEATMDKAKLRKGFLTP